MDDSCGKSTCWKTHTHLFRVNARSKKGWWARDTSYIRKTRALIIVVVAVAVDAAAVFLLVVCLPSLLLLRKLLATSKPRPSDAAQHTHFTPT